MFWLNDSDVYTDEDGLYHVNQERYACQCLYLNKPLSKRDFDSLKVGVSTLNDVAAIDPYLLVDRSYSVGVVSFSVMDKDGGVRIKYRKNSSDDLKDLVVDAVYFEPTDALSLYGYILDVDLPVGFR